MKPCVDSDKHTFIHLAGVNKWLTSSYWPWWSGTEGDHQWTERPWGLLTDTLAAGYGGNWETGCCYSAVTWQCQFEPGSKDIAALGPEGYQREGGRDNEGEVSKYSSKLQSLSDVSTLPQTSAVQSIYTCISGSQGWPNNLCLTWHFPRYKAV